MTEIRKSKQYLVLEGFGHSHLSLTWPVEDPANKFTFANG